MGTVKFRKVPVTTLLLTLGAVEGDSNVYMGIGKFLFVCLCKMFHKIWMVIAYLHVCIQNYKMVSSTFP